MLPEPSVQGKVNSRKTALFSCGTEGQLPGCHFALSNKEKKKPKALEGSKEESPVLPVMKITASWLRKKLRNGRLENQKEGGSRDLTSSGFGLCFYRVRPKKKKKGGEIRFEENWRLKQLLFIADAAGYFFRS